MSWKDTIRRAAAVLLFAVSFLPTAYSQTETATIRGTVADSTGAVIREAKVRLIDIDRGLRTEVVTGSTGFYSFASVHPGL
jgi:protocatechuate 3,4-dioxygenase beta subunit